MNLGKYRFSDLGAVTERVHALFDCWESEVAARPDFDVETLYRMKLAVHEWLANLVQHASFERRSPDISLEIWLNGERIYCAIEDNSEGFDLDGQLVTRLDVLEAYPERGMGLLMLQACTEDLSYGQVSEHRNRLAFAVPTHHDPWLNIPF